MPVPRGQPARGWAQPRRRRRHRAASAGPPPTLEPRASRPRWEWPLRRRSAGCGRSRRQPLRSRCPQRCDRPPGSRLAGIACDGSGASRGRPRPGPSSTRAPSVPPRKPAASVAKIVAQRTPVTACQSPRAARHHRRDIRVAALRRNRNSRSGGEQTTRKKARAAADLACHGPCGSRTCLPPANGVEHCETDANRARASTGFSVDSGQRVLIGTSDGTRQQASKVDGCYFVRRALGTESRFWGG